jgi:hypothetical protein
VISRDDRLQVEANAGVKPDAHGRATGHTCEVSRPGDVCDFSNAARIHLGLSQSSFLTIVPLAGELRLRVLELTGLEEEFGGALEVCVGDRLFLVVRDLLDPVIQALEALGR